MASVLKRGSNHRTTGEPIVLLAAAAVTVGIALIVWQHQAASSRRNSSPKGEGASSAPFLVDGEEHDLLLRSED